MNNKELQNTYFRLSKDNIIYTIGRRKIYYLSVVLCFFFKTFFRVGLPSQVRRVRTRQESSSVLLVKQVHIYHLKTYYIHRFCISSNKKISSLYPTLVLAYKPRGDIVASPLYPNHCGWNVCYTTHNGVTTSNPLCSLYISPSIGTPIVLRPIYHHKTKWNLNV